jgi:hypothetical protein
MLGRLLKIFKIATIVLALIVIPVASSIITAQAGQISDSSAYKGCVDDPECGEDGYCDEGKCIKTKEKKGCVDDSECGDNEYCDDGKCQQAKKW